MKYIVKNCPCLFNSYYASGKTVRLECNDGNHDDKLCRDVTDCVIKQVIDLCNGSIRPNETNLYKASAGRMSLAVNIKGLFDIEEINK